MFIYPTVHGTWTGKVESRTFYAHDTQKLCDVAMIHATNGPNLPNDVGYNVFLADDNTHLIDAATFAPNAYVRVTGDAGLAGVKDANGQIVNSVKDGFGAAESTILVGEIVDGHSSRSWQSYFHIIDRQFWLLLGLRFRLSSLPQPPCIFRQRVLLIYALIYIASLWQVR